MTQTGEHKNCRAQNAFFDDGAQVPFFENAFAGDLTRKLLPAPQEEEKEGRLLPAINHALTLMLAVLLSAFFWFFLRFPDASLLLVTFSMLTAGVCYDIAPATERIKLILLIFCAASALQFLFGMLSQCRFLVLLLPGLATWMIYRNLPNPRAAGVAVIIGHLALLAPGGYMPAISRFFELGFSSLAALIATAFVPLIHRKNAFLPAFPGPMDASEALRISALMTLGVYLMQVVGIPDAIWIPLSIAFIYYGKSPKNSIGFLAANRVLGTPAGLYFGFLYLGCFSYFQYRMIYLLPFWVVLGFFILFYLDNYFVYTLLFMMSFCLYSDFSSGQLNNVHILQTLAGRTVSTAIGVILIVFFEAFFLASAPAAASKKRSLPE